MLNSVPSYQTDCLELDSYGVPQLCPAEILTLTLVILWYFFLSTFFFIIIIIILILLEVSRMQISKMIMLVVLSVCLSYSIIFFFLSLQKLKDFFTIDC